MFLLIFGNSVNEVPKQVFFVQRMLIDRWTKVFFDRPFEWSCKVLKIIRDSKKKLIGRHLHSYTFACSWLIVGFWKMWFDPVLRFVYDHSLITWNLSVRRLSLSLNFIFVLQFYSFQIMGNNILCKCNIFTKFKIQTFHILIIQVNLFKIL